MSPPRVNGPRSAKFAAFGEVCRARRKLLGMTQAAVADRFGVTRAYLTLVEAGRTRVVVDRLPAFAKALDYTATDLMAEYERRLGI